jgi:hypothetical protein
MVQGNTDALHLYRAILGARRASWRIVSSIEQKEDNKGNENNVRRIKEYVSLFM